MVERKTGGRWAFLLVAPFDPLRAEGFADELR
jgi:hypothetical protein